MKALFIVIGIIVSLLVIFLVIAIFTKNDYSVKRSITVNRPVNEVYSYLSNLKNQKDYNTWVMKDPNLKETFTGTDGTVGFVYAWDGNKEVGAGEQEITKLIPDQEIDMEIRFKRPFEGLGKVSYHTGPTGNNQTEISWTMSSRMPFPMNAMLALFNIEKKLGKDLDSSLENVKRHLEQ